MKRSYLDAQRNHGLGVWVRRAAGCAALFAIACSAPADIVRKVALLTALQEVPANASTAFGCAVVAIDTTTNMVSFRIAWQGLTSVETAAHFHGAAAPGANAGVVFGLPAGNPKAGSVGPLTAAQMADIRAGRWYINIHSVMFPGGEIRGQVVDAVCHIDAPQETPPNASPGGGWGVFNIDTVANTLSYHIVGGGLVAAETAAHIHGLALPGTAAPVLVGLPAGSPKVGVWVYPEALERAICRGQTYVNIHSAAFPGGEIRGQIVTTVSPMDGTQETPAVAAPGSAGCGLYSFDEAANAMGFDIRWGGIPTGETAAHIHGFAPPGVAAPVLFPLPPGPRKIGVWGYPAASELAILDGRTYANVHSVAFPGGEIRGQIVPPRWTCPGIRGDANCDGMRDFFDIDPFLEALFNPAVYNSSFCSGSNCAADTDCNGIIDFFDIDAFLDCIFNGCANCP